MKFLQRGTLVEIEEGKQFMPSPDQAGLIPCITQDWQTYEVLMPDWTSREALATTKARGWKRKNLQTANRLWRHRS